MRDMTLLGRVLINLITKERRNKMNVSMNGGRVMPEGVMELDYTVRDKGRTDAYTVYLYRDIDEFDIVRPSGSYMSSIYAPKRYAAIERDVKSLMADWSPAMGD